MDYRTKRSKEQEGSLEVPPPAPLPSRDRVRDDDASTLVVHDTDGLQRAAPLAHEEAPSAQPRDVWRPFRRDFQRVARYFRIPLARRLPRELRPARVCRAASQLTRGTFDPNFRILLQRIDQSPILDGNRVQVFFGAQGAFDSMRTAIEAARREILVEFYVLADDAGKRIADLLVAARGRGVAVRVLADASHRKREAPFWTPLREAGVELRLFQPFFQSPWYRPPRDHRKILVVDREVFFTGGRDSRLKPSERPSPALRDVFVRVEGKTALEMAVVFSEGWDRARGNQLEFEASAAAPTHESGASILVLDSRP
jgi:phosphatidylserine/phosphatidylglycerophosphate/cardiolipin synthase-like enzyme